MFFVFALIQRVQLYDAIPERERHRFAIVSDEVKHDHHVHVAASILILALQLHDASLYSPDKQSCPMADYTMEVRLLVQVCLIRDAPLPLFSYYRRKFFAPAIDASAVAIVPRQVV